LKSWFSGSEAAAATKIAPIEEHTTEAVSGSTQSGERIIFSSEPDIDLYELEELCDAVGWSRRPLRKVKKAIEHFLVASMWQERKPASADWLARATQTMPLMPLFGM